MLITIKSFQLQKVYVIMEIYGHVTKIQAVSRGNLGNAFPQSTSKFVFSVCRLPRSTSKYRKKKHCVTFIRIVYHLKTIYYIIS